MEAPPLGPSGEDITWPDQVAPRGRKASSTRKIKPQTSNLFDWVQGNMLVSQGKVLSPGNEGSMAVIVYVSIFPQLCFICVHMPISGLSSLVQFLYMPAIVRPSMC